MIDTNLIAIVISGIVAMITGYYVYLTQKLLSESIRPVVSIRFDVRDRALFLVLRNSGTRMARDVELTFTPNLAVIANEAEAQMGSSFYDHLLFQNFLGIGEERSEFVTLTPQIEEKFNAGKQFVVVITYSDAAGKRYRDRPFIFNTKDYVTAGSGANIDLESKFYEVLTKYFEDESHRRK